MKRDTGQPSSTPTQSKHAGLVGRRHLRVENFGNEARTPRLSARSLDPKAKSSKKGQYRAKTHALIKGAEVRKVRTGRRDHFVGDVPMTRLNGKLASGESLLEIDALHVVDAYDDNFTDVIAQPFTTTIVVVSRERRWTPDFLLRRPRSVDEVVEVKALSWLYHKDPEKALLARKRIAAMKTACARRGYAFGLWTEDEIRVEPRLYNAKLVHRHCGPFVPSESILLALSALAAAPDSIAIRDFADLIAPIHPIHGLGLAIKLERLGHVRINRREEYSFSSVMTKTPAIGRES